MSVTLLGIAEVAAVGAFAYSGGAVARQRGMDVIGIAALAVCNGLAGGMVRDVLIDRPAVAMHDQRLLVTCLVMAGVVTLVGTVFSDHVVELLDAVGLALFTVLGTRRALDAGVTDIAAVLLGGVTVGAGSVIRDVLAGERPGLFYRSELYVTLAVLGGALFLVGHHLGHHVGIDRSALLLGVAALVFAGRVLALRRGWHSITPNAPNTPAP